jgi:hypothetical protein
MTVGFVQVKEAATGTANPTVTFDSPPTAGNLVLVFLRHSNGNIITYPTGGYGVLFAIHDSSPFSAGDLYSTGEVIGAYGKIAEAGESSTVTFRQEQGQGTVIIAYELSGSWDAEIPLVEGWVSNGSTAVTSRALSNLAVAGDGGAVFSAMSVRTNVSATIGNTMSTDREDIHNSNAATLFVGCQFDADAGTFSDTISWTGAQTAIGFIISVIDQGRNTVDTEDVTATLPGIVIDCGSAATALAGIDDPLAARLVAGQATLNTATTTLSGLLVDKAGLVEDYDAVNAEVFLAPEDEGTTGPDLTHMLGPAIETLDNGRTLRFPTNRYRYEFGNITAKSLVGVTYEGPPFAIEPDVLAGDGPPDETPTFYRTSHQYHPRAPHLTWDACSGITVRRIRIEGDDTVSNTATVPALETHYSTYTPDFEFQAGIFLVNSNGVTLEHIYAYGVWGDGLAVLKTNNITADGLDIRFNGRQSIALSIGEDIELNNLFLPNSRRSSIDLEPHNVSDNNIRRVTIDGVVSDPILTHIAALGGGLVNDITIRNLTAKHARTNLVICSAQDQTRRSNWEISGFVMEEEWSAPEGSRPCLRFNWVDGVTIDDCIVPIDAGGYTNFARFHECGDTVTVTNNDADPGGTTPEFISFTGSYSESGNSWN